MKTMLLIVPMGLWLGGCALSGPTEAPQQAACPLERELALECEAAHPRYIAAEASVPILGATTAYDRRDCAQNALQELSRQVEPAVRIRYQALIARKSELYGYAMPALSPGMLKKATNAALSGAVELDQTHDAERKTLTTRWGVDVATVASAVDTIFAEAFARSRDEVEMPQQVEVVKRPFVGRRPL